MVKVAFNEYFSFQSRYKLVNYKLLVNFISKLVGLVELFKLVQPNALLHEDNVQIRDPVIQIPNPVDHVVVLDGHRGRHLAEDESTANFVVVLEKEVLFFINS